VAWHSQAVSLPSRVIPSLIRTSVCGRPRWVRKVSSRVSFIRTVPPAARASSEVMISKLRVSVRAPKPPPMCGFTTRMRDASRSRQRATIMCT